jgi:hypothetical protein
MCGKQNCNNLPRVNGDISCQPLMANTIHPMTIIRLCGIYRIIRFPTIQSSTIMLYDCKNNCNVDNAMHSREKGRRKRNEEDKEAQKQLV